MTLASDGAISRSRSTLEEPRRSFEGLKNEIAKHLVNLNRGDDFTKQLMHLLQKLIKFQFYVSVEQMRMVVVPILQTLDDRRRFATTPTDHERS